MNAKLFAAGFFCLFPTLFFGQHTLKKDSIRSTLLGEVMITGTSVTAEAQPYSVSTIDGAQLEASGKGQLLSALSGSVPGLFVSERNILGFGLSTGGSGGIKIRGIGGEPTNGVLMMVDGQPQFSGTFSHHVADMYKKEYVDHVEVHRGPASVLYGSNALGGVINVVTKQARQDGCHTTLSSQYGSYNTWQTALTNMARKGRFSSLLSLGFDRTDGVQKGFDFKQGNLYAKVGYDVNTRWTLGADYSLMKFLADDPIYPKAYKNDSTSVYHQNVVRGAASLSATNRYKSSNGHIRVYYSYGNHYVQDPKPFHSLDDRIGLMLAQSFALWQDASATAGFDFDTYSGKVPLSGGKDYTQAPLGTLRRKHITEYSPYVSLSQHLLQDRLQLNAGVRMANSNRFGTHWIPQAGLCALPAEGWTLRGSVARGFRNPSFKELYLYMTANPDLAPEMMTNYELSVGKSFGPLLDVELTAFLSKGDDMISLSEGKYANTGAFTNKGIEFTAKSRPARWLCLQGNYSYLHTNLSQLTAAPRHQYFLSADVTPHAKWQISAQLRGARHLYIGEGEPHEHFATLGLKASYQVCPYVQLFAQADNLTNQRYTILKGYEMPGLTAMGGFKVTF